MTPVYQPFPMLGARRAQAWRYHPAYRRPRHVHDEPEINLVLAGTGLMSVGTDQVELRAGMLLWLPPGLDHCLERASVDFDLVVVGFERELLHRAPREQGQLACFARRVEHIAGDPKVLGEQLLAAAARTDDRAVEEHLVDSLVTLSGVARPRGIGERAAELLAEERALQRDDLARRLGINRGDLSRRFQRAHGISIADYRNRLRILSFLGESQHRPGNLMRAALSSGFGSYSQCHRAFRQLFGVGPREYLFGGGVDPDRFEPWE